MSIAAVWFHLPFESSRLRIPVSGNRKEQFTPFAIFAPLKFNTTDSPEGYELEVKIYIEESSVRSARRYTDL